MGLTDTRGGRVIYSIGAAVTVTLAGAVFAGDPIGYSSGWVAADASTPIAPVLIAGMAGKSGEKITAYSSALIKGFTGGTPGSAVYLSDSPGQYSESSGTNTYTVGRVVESDAVFINLSEGGTIDPSDISLSNARILIGQTTGLAGAKDVSGDVTIANTGAVTIGSEKVTRAKILTKDRPQKDATFVIASSDATESVKAQADYVCDGTDDNVEFTSAIAALPTGGGIIEVVGDTFNFSGVVTISRNDVEIKFNNNLLNMTTQNRLFSVTGDRVSFRGRAIFDGNKSTNTSGWIVLQVTDTADDFYAENLEIRNCHQDGFSTGTGLRNVLRNIYTHDNDRDGCNIGAGTTAYDVVASSNGRYGMWVNGGVVIGCKVRDNADYQSLNVTDSGARVINCELGSSGTSTQNVIRIWDSATDWVVQGCKLYYSEVKVDGTGASRGIVAENTLLEGSKIEVFNSVSDVLIIGNHISGGGQISVNTVSRIQVIGNRVVGATDRGIIAVSAADSVISGNSIINSAGNNQIQLNTCSRCVVSDNVVYANTAGAGGEAIDFYASTQCTAVGNKVRMTSAGNNNRGISFDTGANDNICTGNVLEGLSESGICVFNSSRVQIIGNLCENNGTYGTKLDQASYCFVDGNRCRDTGGGVQDYGIYESTASGNNFIGENICEGNATAHVVIGAGTTSTSIRAANDESLDLSGAAADVPVFVATRPCRLVGYKIVYTEASSADAGVNIRIGKYADGVAFDDDYFDVVTSESSKGLGYIKSYVTSDLTNSEIAVGDVVTVGTAGGKTGTGEVKLVLLIA